MGVTSIAWCDFTFNHIRGCTKVSPGCANCYAETMSKRNHKTLGIWGPNGTRVVASESTWREPLKWHKESMAWALHLEICKQHGIDNPIADWIAKDNGNLPPIPRRPRVFCASLADVFESWDGPIHNHKGEKLWIVSECGIDTWIFGEETDQNQLSKQRGVRRGTMDDVRRRLFDLIDATPYLDWLLLSKRPENILKMWPSPKSFGVLSKFYGPGGFDESGSQPEKLLPRSNVWLGTTVENQEQADKRIPELLKYRDLSPVLFLSCEPLLSEIDFFRGPSDWGNLTEINWVIVGGESGPKFRPMQTEWVQSLHDQCKSAGVPFFCKQGSGPKSGHQYDLPDHLFSVKEFSKS